MKVPLESLDKFEKLKRNKSFIKLVCDSWSFGTNGRLSFCDGMPNDRFFEGTFINNFHL